MIALLTLTLFATAFAASVWTMFATIRAQMPRIRELLGAPAAVAALPMRPNRVTVRWSAPARSTARTSLRAAA